ncbi:MAG TPA: hypothetical protein VMT76_00775 [Puia sp.]|nr:hypothetical protein [Puia sp.]
MKKINEQATKIFCRLIDKMNNEEYLKLSAEGYMPLVIERIAENIMTDFGAAKLYSLAHYYEQNGDLMSDPQMCFLVIDQRTQTKDIEHIFIYPQMYQLDGLGIYEESILIKDNRVIGCKKAWQDGHCGFANLWLNNIRQQGFLK